MSRVQAQRLRIFLGIFPPEEVQAAAADLIERLRRPGDGISWVKRENLHFTIRFLGELGESGAERAAEAAREAASGHHAFEVMLGVLGAFPNPRRARVLWLGPRDGAAPLEAVADSIEATLRRKGFDRADRRFSAHLTLGRVRERDQDWTERLAATSTTPARFRVDRVLVVHSRLSPKGSIYTVRAEAPLTH